jgi:chemotaxis protein histidine kinase CheA
MSDVFAERLEKVRSRFGARLDARIEGIELVLPQRDRYVGLDVLAQAHRHAHDLCGVGSTLGHAETGKVARSIEQLLLAAVQAQRALTDDEVPRVRERIVLLRSTAIAEMGQAGQE